MKVSQILRMKDDGGVTTIAPGATVREAAALLSDRGIGAVIVGDDDAAPAGILSERDIVRELGRRGPEVLDDAVSAMMTVKLVSCAPEDEAVGILSTMTDGRFRHMPVMKDGKMVGLISIGDVVKARLSELAAERDALEGMVMGH